MSRHPEGDGLQASIEQLARATRGHLFGREQAFAEWEDRFAGLEPSLPIPGAWQSRLVLPRVRAGPPLRGSGRPAAPHRPPGFGCPRRRGGPPHGGTPGVTPRQAAKLLATLEDRVSRYGGHPYAIGLLKAHEAARILGPAQMRELVAWKRRYDPQHLLNPGKVLPSPGISWRVRAALAWSRWLGGSPSAPAEREGGCPGPAGRGARTALFLGLLPRHRRGGLANDRETPSVGPAGWPA